MFRTLLTGSALALAVVLSTPGLAGDDASALFVHRAKVQFSNGSSNDIDATMRLRAGYPALEGPSHFETQGDAVEVAIAGQTFRVATGDEGVRVRRKRTRLIYRRPAAASPDGIRSLFVDTLRGRVRVVLDLADDDALRSTGGWDVPICVRIGDAGFAQEIDMRVARGFRARTWRHRVKDPSFRPIPLTDTPSASFSDVGGERQVVIRDAEAWADLWNELDGTPEARPDVDFTKDVVVGVFLGARTGFTVTADRVIPTQDGAIVRFTEHGPGPHCFVPQVVTYPYVLAKLPNRAGSTGANITFHGRVRRHDCRR